MDNILRLGINSLDREISGVYLDNPEALKDLKEGVDYVVIKKYRGKIGYLRDKYGMIHFYGTGSTNFYTL